MNAINLRVPAKRVSRSSRASQWRRGNVVASQSEGCEIESRHCTGAFMSQTKIGDWELTGGVKAHAGWIGWINSVLVNILQFKCRRHLYDVIKEGHMKGSRSTTISRSTGEL